MDYQTRMQWFNEARFGMFIHWGLYSQLGRHEWAMETEGIPVAEYEKLAATFKPKPNAARDWARLAKQAGQKYMVMTTKHHEGFCHFDSKLTSYCAPKQACGRDLVGLFRQFQELGLLEIITSAATHALLPLLADHPPSLRAQVLVARDHYRACVP